MLDNIQNFETHYRAFLKDFNEKAHLNKLATITSIVNAQTYAYENSGKRIRAYLITLFCEFFQVNKKVAFELGMIIEKVHCYSLIHDDLPAMDNANLRRGRATLHKEFGEATAILAGDGLLTDVFYDLSLLNIDKDIKLKIINFLSLAAGSQGMVLGQAYDLHFEKNIAAFDTLSKEDQLFYLYKTQFLKTGCLFIFCTLAVGTLYGKDFLKHHTYFETLSPKFNAFWKSHPLVQMGEEEGLDPFLQFGTIIGLLFQLVDDRLDEGDSEKTGKDSHLDKAAQKVNFLNYYGREILDQEIQNLAKQARFILDRLQVLDDSPLYELIQFIVSRDY